MYFPCNKGIKYKNILSHIYIIYTYIFIILLQTYINNFTAPHVQSSHFNKIVNFQKIDKMSATF